jgi:hypothetical protein
MVKSADIGTVIYHVMKIVRSGHKFKSLRPFPSPTPITEPIAAWIELIGIPRTDARMIVIAVEKSTLKPLAFDSNAYFVPLFQSPYVPGIKTPLTFQDHRFQASK